MIGSVTFPWIDGDFVATLDDAGVWACADAEIQDMLNSWPDTRDLSPAVGIPRRDQVNRIAAMLGGTVDFPAAADEPAGRIF